MPRCTRKSYSNPKKSELPGSSNDHLEMFVQDGTSVIDAEIKQEEEQKHELNPLESKPLGEVKVEPLEPIGDPFGQPDRNFDQPRCQFCLKSISRDQATITRKMVTYVLGVRKLAAFSEKPDCCLECKKMFETFHEFKKSCLAALARSKELLAEKKVSNTVEPSRRDSMLLLVEVNDEKASKISGSPIQKFDSDVEETGFQDDTDEESMEPVSVVPPTENTIETVFDSPEKLCEMNWLTYPETSPKETAPEPSIPLVPIEDLAIDKPKKRRNVKSKDKTPRKKSNAEHPTSNHSGSGPEDGFDSAPANSVSKEGSRKPKKNKKTKYACDQCPETFTTEHQWTLHMNRHKGIRTVACRREGCDKKFFDTQHRHAHEIGCGKDVKIMCSVCAAIFRSMSALRTHMASHGELKHFCKVCGKGFYRKAKLDKHASVHSDARNFECNVCGKRFKSKEANRVHQRVHTEERPYACHICSRAFRYNCGLKAHLERGHDPADLRQQDLAAGNSSFGISGGLY